MKLINAPLKALLLILCFITLANARLDTVRFQSKLINATLPYNAILPTWAYWDRQVQEILKIAADKMRMPRKRTSRA